MLLTQVIHMQMDAKAFLNINSFFYWWPQLVSWLGKEYNVTKFCFIRMAVPKI